MKLKPDSSGKKLAVFGKAFEEDGLKQSTREEIESRPGHYDKYGFYMLDEGGFYDSFGFYFQKEVYGLNNFLK